MTSPLTSTLEFSEPTGATDGTSFFNAAGTLRLVRPFVSSALVSADAWSALHRVASSVPAGVVSAMYLECRLRDDSSPVDWIARVDSAGRTILAGRNPRVALPRAPRADAAWDLIARFCVTWMDDPGLREAVACLWLEFDLGADDADGVALELPTPSVFVGMRDVRRANLAPLAVRLLQFFCGGASRDTKRALMIALERRDPEATVPYLGFLLGRRPVCVRVYVGDVGVARLPEVVQSLGWPGDRIELAAQLARLQSPTGAPLARCSMLHLDVHDGVLGRVGVEYALDRRAQLRGRLHEYELLERMVQLGLCGAKKRAGLLAWPGCFVATLPHELWQSLIARRVNCLKLVYEPGRRVSLKGYLLSDWRPLPRRRRSLAPDS